MGSREMPIRVTYKLAYEKMGRAGSSNHSPNKLAAAVTVRSPPISSGALSVASTCTPAEPVLAASTMTSISTEVDDEVLCKVLFAK